MKTYYIRFCSYNKNTMVRTESYSVRNTNKDMDSAEGLIEIIKELNLEYKTEIFIGYWKELTNKKEGE